SRASRRPSRCLPISCSSPTSPTASTTSTGWKNTCRNHNLSSGLVLTLGTPKTGRMASRDDIIIEITPQVLLKAYTCGIFPMAESAEDPALYWIEPQLRGILPLDHVHVPRRLVRTIRQGMFEVRIDTDFEGVLDGCAASRAGRRTTWINRK